LGCDRVIYVYKNNPFTLKSKIKLLSKEVTKMIYFRKLLFIATCNVLEFYVINTKNFQF
jgi:hypothetical protein